MSCSSFRRHASSGVVDLVLNAPPGFVAGLLMGLPWEGRWRWPGSPGSPRPASWRGCSATSAGLANRETPAVLSVLVLEDLAMALFLPLLVVALAGEGPTVGGGRRRPGGRRGAARAAAAQRHGHRLGRLLSHDDDEQVLLRLVGLTLLVAGLAQAVGASAAVGAFLVGLALPATFADRARAILRPLRDLFAALFFVAFGLATDPGAILPVLPMALALAVVTAVTKVGTGWFAARRDGVAVPGRAGTALVARGEFSIVIAGLAVAAGIPGGRSGRDRLRPAAGGRRAGADPRGGADLGPVARLWPRDDRVGQAAAPSRRARATATTAGASAAPMAA